MCPLGLRRMRGKSLSLWRASEEASYVTGSAYGRRRPVHGARQLAGVPKLALDFLPRPATMRPRQHAGAKLTINKTGKTRSATAPLRGRVSVWLWR